MAQDGFDHDWLIVGSGFGGSVSALRLSEKGYRVAMLECGRRYRDEDYAATTWDLRRFMWAPALGLRGILRLTPFKDVFIASGSAVGGGSVVYACTLYRAAPEFFVNRHWAGLEDWAAALKPHYDTAARMLGVNTVPFDSDGQTLLRKVAGHFGVEDTFADGSDGYRVTTERPGAWFNKRQRSFTTRGVVVAAGALGTNRLLAKCNHGGSLPGISDRLGELVRTNSESILAVTLPDDRLNPANDVAISASIHPRADTHIEFVTYGAKGDFMSTQFTLITGAGTRLGRPLRLLGSIVRHPLRFAKVLWPFGWGRRTVIFLVMQTLDNAIAFRAKRGWFGGIGLRTEQDPEKPNPTFIPVANEAAEWLAQHTGGIAQSMVLEAAANIPSTAHILGGAVIGKDAASGVVDRHNRVFGYRNLLVCDGAAMPANPGVNPSLTITAITEHAMSHIPPAQAAPA